jgi:hypothetical protein
MIYMFEELEKLAVELGQALPKIVVTCSAESLSMKRMKRDAAALNSSHLPPPPPGPTVGNESLVGYDAGKGLSLAKEKNSVTLKSPAPDSPSRPPLHFLAHPRRA